MRVNGVLHLNAIDGFKKLPDKSVDCIMTSPPYWQLRNYPAPAVIWDETQDCNHTFDIKIHKKTIDMTYQERLQKEKGSNSKLAQKVNELVWESGYCTKCGAWKGELGLEPTFNLFIKHLCDIFDEAKRVLKDSGALWVNLGDTYSGAKEGNTNEINPKANASNFKKPKSHLKDKCLCNIPPRFAIEMTERGWIQRNTIIWYKPNAMPSSAKDRFTVDFEYLFFFTKAKKYHFNQIFEDFAPSTYLRCQHKYNDDTKSVGSSVKPSGQRIFAENLKAGKLKGRNKRTVWAVKTKSFKGAHFAIFPEALVRPVIESTCPEFICTECGFIREKIYDKKTINRTASDGKGSGALSDGAFGIATRREIEFSDCGCGAKWKAGVVVDPFAGSGTVGVVAKKMRRNYILFEISKKYIKIIKKRLIKTKRHKRVSF